jgi:6-phosphofructokinase 1
VETFLQVRAAIVTCGGLCPGLNDVIRQTVFSLEVYGVKEILGLQYGFRGFADKKYPPIMLSRKIVQRINMVGGSFLGVSRGCPPLDDIVDKLAVTKSKPTYICPSASL